MLQLMPLTAQSGIGVRRTTSHEQTRGGVLDALVAATGMDGQLWASHWQTHRQQFRQYMHERSLLCILLVVSTVAWRVRCLFFAASDMVDAAEPVRSSAILCSSTCPSCVLRERNLCMALVHMRLRCCLQVQLPALGLLGGCPGISRAATCGPMGSHCIQLRFILGVANAYRGHARAGLQARPVPWVVETTSRQAVLAPLTEDCSRFCRDSAVNSL